MSYLDTLLGLPLTALIAFPGIAFALEAEVPPLPSKIIFPLKIGEASLSISDFEGAVTLLPADGPGIVIEETSGKSLGSIRLNQSGQHVMIRPAPEKKAGSDRPDKSARKRREDASQTETPVPATPTPPPPPASSLSLQIYLPSGSRLKIENIPLLNARLALGDTRIDVKNCQQFSLLEVSRLNFKAAGRCQMLVAKASSADMDLLGAAKVQINELAGGEFAVNAKDSSSATARGSFAEIDVKTEDSSRVVTSGLVSGKFKALALNSSLIGHNGPVRGKISRKLSDTAQINLSPIIK